MKPSLMEIRRHELLEEIESLVIALCKDYNLEQDICEQIGANVANHLCENFSGQVITFPKDYFYKIAQRDLDIYNSFNGRNWGELGRKYDLTENALRKIVKRVQDKIAKEKQPDLFT
ncbi:Mor transcription activator family protein [Aggregatibacter actinomycetemcomitans]|uniref:Mor transcription activator family protein n=1 Tax=Aggregatibacter actinomycetemcomitans TaxID=714 RepID=UPI00197BE89F|nr:Mor transcription activator family protein [Aggregatibacter actinomycetemcomitans]MBN6077286.1 DNA-binding protein [Aggregatibacter actinomycetemcomitans]MBN6080041.1 DNA-binding protein [Aggregatibacter actinomycetemcomitans]